MENKDRLRQILRFAEGLKQHPNGTKILQEAIEKTQKLSQEVPGVSKTTHLLKQVQRALISIPEKKLTINFRQNYNCLFFMSSTYFPKHTV